MTGAILDAYRVRVAAGELAADADQERAAQSLDGLDEALHAPVHRGWFSSAKPAPKGIYLWGEVGRGKSMLMDLFFDTTATAPKRRVHFNAFMTETHERIHAWRAMDARERARQPQFVAGAGDNPLPPVAKHISLEACLLCLDEFQVTDVADAMILGRLFESLFAFGVTTVLTSNTQPDRLYEGGLNRQLFLPFTDMLKQHLNVVALNGPRDYRLERLAGMQVYLTPLGAAADAAMDAVWTRLTGTTRGEPATLVVQGRELRVPQAAKGAARFTFDELCARPVGAADYLAVARTYHTVFVDQIPVMTPAMPNEARRFTLLIDTLYDEHVKLVCSAAGKPDELYRTGDNVESFHRAVSRLMEMQSADYLSLAHGVHDITQMRHDD
jgi:cell division protein ZapE